MTGVTAMVRGTAALMERNGMTYPAGQIGGLLRSADLTHVSNEIAFDPACPHPHFQGDELVFCSRPEYIQLLEYIGTDVVEMTGDHFIDVQPSAVLYTLDLYKNSAGDITLGVPILKKPEHRFWRMSNPIKLPLSAATPRISVMPSPQPPILVLFIVIGITLIWKSPPS